MTISSGPAMPALPPVSKLLAGARIVALVPCAPDLDQAAGLAWSVARAAAKAGVRVTLVDCYVDEPRLHTVAGQPNDAGIVDVFEYGVSLTRIARPQREPGLRFVPAGTYAPDRVATMADPGWRRLAAEFERQHEGVLLFLPPECLGTLALKLDGILALAPGAEAASPPQPALAAAVASGVRLIATLTGEESLAWQGVPAGAPGSRAETAEVGATPPAEPALAPEAPAMDRAAIAPGTSPAKAAYAALLRRREEQRRRLRLGLSIGGGVAVVGVAAAILISAPRTPSSPVAVRTEAGAPAPATRAAPGGASHAVEPLPYAVAVLAATTPAAALTRADRLERAGVPAMVSMMRGARRVQYTVYAGPVASRGAADSLVQALRRAGLDRTRSARAARVPFSFALVRNADLGAARVERARLRRAGIPSFVLGQADGTFRLFAGAFSAATQGAYLARMLNASRNGGVMGERVGFRP